MSRRIEDLHPVLQQKLAEMKELAFDAGIEFVVTSTLRTEAEQLALFAQGRQTLKEVNALRKDAGLQPIKEKENKRPVTWRLDSPHLRGLAFDIAVVIPPTPPLVKGGSGGIIWNPEADINKNGIADYGELGRLGESIGLRWGGRFETLRDRCHFEWTAVVE